MRTSRRRRLVVVLAAVLVVGIGGASASAVDRPPGWHGPLYEVADGVAEVKSELEKFLKESNKPDYHPRDAKVAAPSSVITATAPDNPVRRVQAVNSYRPNPQSWVLLKEKATPPASITKPAWDKAVAQTARWAPKLVKGATIAGVLAVGAEVAWEVRDGVLYPALGIAADQTEETYCVRRGNLVTDALGSVVGADCADWRLNKDYADLVATGSVATNNQISCVATNSANGWCSMFSSSGVHSGQSQAWVCFTGYAQTGLPKVYQRRHIFETSWGTFSPTAFTWTGGPNCASGYQTGGANVNRPLAMAGIPFILYSVKVEKQEKSGAAWEADKELTQKSADNAEWITRVRCSDGTSRVAVSETFQQKKLGAVAVPESVALQGCTPVGVDVGVQKGGRGTTAPAGPWPETATDGSPVGVQTGEVPQPVKDWQTNYPQCQDGSCVLELKKVLNGSMELACFDSPDECADWQKDPSSYRCYYAGTLQTIAECNVYGRTFQTSAVQKGEAYSDPKTGEEVKTGTGEPATSNPGAATVAQAEAVANPDTKRECWPTGWGVLNPFEWVYKPVRCVFEWAFIPRTVKVDSLKASLQLAALNSKPGEIIDGLRGWTAAVPTGNGCEGPAVGIHMFGLNYDGHPFSACSGALATAATWSRVALTIVMIIIGLIAITRNIARVFGYVGIADGQGSV